MSGNSNSSSRSNRSSNNNTAARAETVIASTAGKDTWQTWAGRKDGNENFEFLDVFRGMKRSLDHSFRSKLPPAGTTCPICFCEPDSNNVDSKSELSSSSSSWYVTWCGHAVCTDCLITYAANQVGDKEQSGPLKCPVCLKTLRKKDAIVAMAGNKDLIRQWDMKIRDQLLQAIPSFRSCPKCGGNGNDGDNNNNNNNNNIVNKNENNNDGDDGDGVTRRNGGGGFVTPECLGPHHQERREMATRILLKRNTALLGIVVVYFILVGIIAKNKSRSVSADLFSMILPIYVFGKAAMAMQYFLAVKAREELFRPISVGCPCCDEVFILPAESEQFSDEETSRWMDANTRPCPSCSVPIVKASGCNHMRCSHCKANFCWACMKLRTSCRAYKCTNGAPYRDASIFDGSGVDEVERRQALQSDGSILTYIDYILNNRRCPELHYSDGILILVCLVARHSSPVQFVGNKMVTPFVISVIMPLIYLGFTPAVLFFLATTYRHFLQMRLTAAARGGDVHQGHNNNNNNNNNNNLVAQAAQELQQPLPGNNPNLLLIETLNQNMLTEALRRSVEDT